MKIYTNTAKLVREFRERGQAKRSEFCRLFNMNQTTYTRIEEGQAQWPIKKVQEIVKQGIDFEKLKTAMLADYEVNINASLANGGEMYSPEEACEKLKEIGPYNIFEGDKPVTKEEQKAIDFIENFKKEYHK